MGKKKRKRGLDYRMNNHICSEQMWDLGEGILHGVLDRLCFVEVLDSYSVGDWQSMFGAGYMAEEGKVAEDWCLGEDKVGFGNSLVCSW